MSAKMRVASPVVYSPDSGVHQFVQQAKQALRDLGV